MPWFRLKDDRDNDIPRRAGVSSYGFSGENVHVVIEEFIRPPVEATTSAHPLPQTELILLSARTKERLRVLAENLADHLEGAGAAGSIAALRELAYTLQVGREAMTERAAFVRQRGKRFAASSVGWRMIQRMPRFCGQRFRIRDRPPL